VALGVKAAWVLGLWRLKKLTHETAKAELLLTRDRAPKWMLEVDAQQQLEVQDQLRRAQVEREATFAWQPLKEHVPQELEFLKQFEGPPQLRYKFLVYEGASGCGTDLGFWVTDPALH
jgi:hypothetical protein